MALTYDQYRLDTFVAIVRDVNELVFGFKITIKLAEMPIDVDKKSKSPTSTVDPETHEQTSLLIP
jgi:hypothetical protein